MPRLGQVTFPQVLRISEQRLMSLGNNVKYDKKALHTNKQTNTDF